MSNKREYPVDPEAIRRAEICKKCEFFKELPERNNNKVCAVCGCLLLHIVNMPAKVCPMEKW